ncbi:MAG: DUF1127 domain-containing protein [Pseudomonadota bacterium]
MQKPGLVKDRGGFYVRGKTNLFAQEMTQMAHTFHRARPVGMSARTSLSVGSLVGRIHAWNDARRTRNVLSQLSDHVLDDIGLNRGDIERLSDKRF